MSVARRPLAIGELLTGRRALPQSSAYRNLTVLEQAGVIRRVITEGDFARFELDEGLTEHHHHLVCSNCGRVEDVAIPASVEGSIDQILDRVTRDVGFATVGHRLDLIGLCRSCA
jgi:Fe2+ or Zn2+ uptake regulation protein